MTQPISHCTEHGWYAEETCPQCGVAGEQVLSGARRERLSKFCSGALRHFPDDAGLTLDDAGWTVWESLVDAVASRYDWAGERELRALVATDPKGRFETVVRDTERRVRAAYGHSVAVDLDGDDRESRDDDLPATLYHGTAPRTHDAIRAEGLKPMGRQQVHLSGDRATARTVGGRHTDADPVVLAVDVQGLSAAGFDIRRRGRNTYTVDRVPPRFLSRDPPE